MLNWPEFEKLPDSPRSNFEILCRSLIWLHYGRFGRFAALANQPGVEFHLKLHEKCAIGDAGRWFGWQCRWYEARPGKALGNARRKKIEDALRKTVKALPDLTDWILWTRHPLTKADQVWFYGLETNMQLDLWTAANVEALLSGEGEILRRTYFGELVFTPIALAQQHELSVASIKKRWLPKAHQVVDAERTLRRMLGEPSSWNELAHVSERILNATTLIKKTAAASQGSLSRSTPMFVHSAEALAKTLKDVHQLLQDGDLAFLRQRLDTRPRGVSRDVAAGPRRLRGAKLSCGLDATNALADMRLGVQLLNEAHDFLETRSVAVVADAGGGKTQLAAQLTAALPHRPAGILLYGRDLHSGLDDLAKSICIQGDPVPSMEALVAALDAAGQRARRRLPLVIDGLNEAEDPRKWKAPLAAFDTQLRRFANVIVVYTVRTGARRPEERRWPALRIEEPPARQDFAKQALPDDVQQIELPDFGGDTIAAIRKYFEYFRIDPGDVDVPVAFFSHPLTLRIYCEVTNPKRDREVTIQSIAGSLTELFELYIDRAIERIAELAPSNQRYYEKDIRDALHVFGFELWRARARELAERELRKLIGDQGRAWNHSIVHMLEQEGLVLCTPGDLPGEKNIVSVYDALGGHFIANAVLTNVGRDGLAAWLKQTPTVRALNGNTAECHPLASDIFRALVGLVPRRHYGPQLWQLVEDPLRTVALRIAANLEGKYLDETTVTELAKLVRNGTADTHKLFVRLFQTRGIPEHPLNAEFIDRTLRAMPMSERDLNWTEWIRQDRQEIKEDLQQLETRWQKNTATRTSSDRLRAKWVQWLLTTTVLNLRDRAARALYWFGRGEPEALFEEAINASSINDPYIFERILAASYGVAMAQHCDPRNGKIFRHTILPKYARQIFDLMFAQNAPGRTTHILTREYGRRFIELASRHRPKLFSKQQFALSRPPYSIGNHISWPDIKTDKQEFHGLRSPFRMDFENYTLGWLAEDRGNYDFQHVGYRKIRGQILWRVQQLGWTAEKFEHIDRAIESQRYHYGRAVDEHHKIDRYGKKYSWIAYFELHGWLKDRGLLKRADNDGRTSDVNIDPSFPSPTAEHRVICADLLGHPSLSLRDWIKKGPKPDFRPYLRQRAILNDSGPWVALDGYVTQQDEERGRRLFAFLRSFLVSSKDRKEFARRLNNQSLGGRWLPEKPESYYVFTGEIPWCEVFRQSGQTQLRFVISEKKVKRKRKQRLLYVDGKPTNLTVVDLMRFRISGMLEDLKIGDIEVTETDLARLEVRNRMVEVDETHQEFRKFRSMIPVCDFYLAGRLVDNVPTSGDVLAKELAQSAGLVHLPQTHDLQTRDGIRATYGTAVRAGDFNNTQTFFYIREHILTRLLQKLRMSLVWAVWGERQLSYKQIERARPGGDLAGFGHENFQSVHVLGKSRR